MGKTRKVMAGITSTALTFGLAGCGTNNADIPPPPEDESCRDWDWDDEDGIWECDDSTSRYFGYYYFGGLFYASKSSLLRSNAYQSYKNSSSYKGRSKGSSGFGSGTKSFGG